MKKTFDEISQYFKEHGCELLENEYLNAHVKMKYRCSCGSISFINFNNFRSGKRCGCGRNGVNRLSNIEIKKEVESLGFSFVSSEFVNNQHMVKCVCKCGVLREVQLKSIRISDGCFTCRNQNFALKYQEVFDYFAEQGCKLLEKEYKNARTKLRYVCSCGTESSIVFDSFKRGNRCRKCGNKKNSLQQRLSQEEVTKQFSDHGCVLQDTYDSAIKKVNFICACGKNGFKSLNNFQKKPFCKACGVLKRISKIIKKHNTPEKLDLYLKSLPNRKKARAAEKIKKIKLNKQIVIENGEVSVLHNKKIKKVRERKGRPKGQSCYQYRIDREIMRLEFYYRQNTYRVMKQIGLKPSGFLKDCYEVSGYHFHEFAEHLMNFKGWDELGKYTFHLDHIYPVWAFVAAGILDIKLINSLDNLRVISYEENHKKSYKFNAIEFVKWLASKGIVL